MSHTKEEEEKNAMVVFKKWYSYFLTIWNRLRKTGNTGGSWKNTVWRVASVNTFSKYE